MSNDFSPTVSGASPLISNINVDTSPGIIQIPVSSPKTVSFSNTDTIHNLSPCTPSPCIQTQVSSPQLKPKSPCAKTMSVLFIIMMCIVVLIIIVGAVLLGMWLGGYNFGNTTTKLSATQIEETYIPLGVANANDLEYSTQMSNESDYNKLIDVCNATIDCNGVIYDQNHSALITSDIIIKNGANIIDVPSQNLIFINTSKTQPIVEDKVFVFNNSKPQQFWLTPDFTPTQQNEWSGFSTLTRGQVHTINWVPTVEINASKLVGIWSINPFEAKDFKIILAGPIPPGTYIDDINNSGPTVVPNTYALNLPPIFGNNNTIYVMYDYKPSGSQVSQNLTYMPAI